MVMRHAAQRGITYLWVLFLVFIMGLGMGKALDVYSTVMRRQQEQELLYVGGVYRRAIKSYYLSSAGGQSRYPMSLNDLLLDRRFLTVHRHLRALYPDPVTGKPFQALKAPDGGIWGVASSSIREPLKTGHFSDEDAGFDGATSYHDWQFVYVGR